MESSRLGNVADPMAAPTTNPDPDNNDTTAPQPSSSYIQVDEKIPRPPPRTPSTTSSSSAQDVRIINDEKVTVDVDVEAAGKKAQKPKGKREGKSWYRRNPLKSRFPPALPKERTVSRERTSSYLSQLTFWWMNGLMGVGYNRPLEAVDIPILPTQRRTTTNTEKIMAQFKMRAARGDKYPLLFALNHTFKREFWLAGIVRVTADTCLTLSPLLLKYLIRFATEAYYGHPEPIGKGVGLAFGLMFLQMLASLCVNQFMYRGMVVGGMTRASLISMIYAKSQIISSRAKAEGGTLTRDEKAAKKDDAKKKKSGKEVMPGPDDAQGWSNGKVVNLMGTDTYRIDQAASWCHLIWTSPIQITLTLVLLIVNLGVSALAGFALLLIMTPFITWTVQVFARRRKLMNKITDKRVGLTQEILQGVRFVKYFAWENSFLAQLKKLRKREIRAIQFLLGIRSGVNAVSMSIPVFASILAFVTYSLLHPALNAASVFSSLALFNGLRLPLNFLPVVVAQSIDAYVSLGRIQEYLLADNEEESRDVDPDQEHALTITNGSFTWETSGTAQLEDTKKKSKKEVKAEKVVEQKKEDEGPPFHIDDLNLAISRKELIAVVGTVGSGKSSLLAALAGDMRKTAGVVTQGSTMAYCPQYAWIQNTTVKENIIFGRPFDEEWYEAVIEACALRMDLEMLPNGDQTEIGERGITVSGGQKQRLNIARAIYFNAEIVLLDDPLSAVDAHVGRHIFNEAICGLLKDKCRVLATHQLHVLNRCDRIIWMNNGRMEAIGTFDELMVTQPGFVEMMSMTASEEAPEKKKKRADDEVGEDTDDEEEIEAEKSSNKPAAVKGPGLMQAEERAVASVGWNVYYAYIKASGTILVAPFIIVMLCVSQTTNIMSTIWLSWWTSRRFGLENKVYIGVYVALGCAQAIFMFTFALTLTVAGTEASKNLMHKAMVSVLRAPMSFFDTTPLGRIVNRFSKDVDVMDNNLTDAMRMYFFTLVMVTSVFILIIVYFPYFAIALGPLAICFFFAASYYRSSAREIKRHEAVLRSVVFSRFGEALSGTATIRAYGLQDQFKTELDEAIDAMDSAYFITFANQRWLSVRLDAIGNLLVFTTAILVVTSRFDVSPSTAGVVLSYILQVIGMVQFMIRQLAEVENAMNSTERIHYYGNYLPVEAPLYTNVKPAPTWPEKGELVFENVEMRYRDGLPLVLKGLDLHVRGGERIGVVGRTGAGKSSIMSTLFRLVELSSGKITIDGIDISTVGLQDLRSRLSIIPQDPTLFRGTVRSNLDPFGEHTDLELWEALRQSYLVSDDDSANNTPPLTSHDAITSARPSADFANVVAANKNKISLDAPVLEEGLNFSLGQRQLMALARALVRSSRIIVCDEATSSVDEETDRKIQRTMLTGFKGATVLCIAHRLRTIVRYDRVVVLDGGRIVEVDTPKNLWEREGGVFRGMCDRSKIRKEDFEAEV